MSWWIVVSFVGKGTRIRYAADLALPLVPETAVLGDLATITRARNAFQKRRGVGFYFRPRSAYRVRDVVPAAQTKIRASNCLVRSCQRAESPHNTRSHKRR